MNSKRRPKKEYDCLALFEAFIKASKTGRRLQPNGNRYAPGTIRNYEYVCRHLKLFTSTQSFHLRIREAAKLNRREDHFEMNYWKKFYRKFTDYLYGELGFFDNYVGQVMKILRTFFNYLNHNGPVKPGHYYRQFYVRKEEIPIFPLLPEELNYLIFNQDFTLSLKPRLREVKDVFVFGCTVALRVSDLLRLKKQNIRKINEQVYLSIRSKKTTTDSMIQLPPYCIDILQKYEAKKYIRGILPKFNPVNLNQYIKLLLEKAGFVQEVEVTRTRRGKAISMKSSRSTAHALRFCDIASTHTMRRTAITSMLCLGMPEPLVRRISGHAPNSKDFFRYVLFAQSYQDGESTLAFAKLRERVLLPAS